MRLTVPTRRMARPSLIPLIDVMLVLLFFFMLASSYVGYSRTQLELAPEAGREGPAESPDVVSAVLLVDGQVRIGARLFSLNRAITELRAAREVRLSPAPGVPLQVLLAGWEQMGAAGIKVQLAEALP